jgi:hypothetical protein
MTLGASEPGLFPCLGNCHSLRADELSFQLWLAFFEEHINAFLEIGIQFVQGPRMTVSTRETRDIAHLHTGVGTSLDDCRVRFHRSLLKSPSTSGA